MADTLVDLYDSPEGQLGPMLFGGHLHWGYWDGADDPADFATAAERLARIMIDRTEIGPDGRFVDLGCGIGHPALKLAQARGCRVDGVTISGYQARKATEKAAEAGLSDRLTFIHGNALSIPRADASYDGGWFFESIFHMGHAAALAEAARVLKPGALLTLTDLPTLPGTTEAFRAFVKEHIHSSFVPVDEYPALMSDAGFDLIGIDDITPNVMPMLAAKLKEALDAHAGEIARTVPTADAKMLDNWLYLFEYMSENLGYTIVSARKL
jgi:cyclopropane fatty-acyl-phospholipid synthase-like methyltransferase